MVSCGGTLVKVLLNLFNIFLFLLGLFLVYCGYVIFDRQDMDAEAWRTIVQTNFKTGSIVLMALGALIVLIAALGILGSCLESTTILDSYGYIIFILVIFEIILFYYSFKYKNDLTVNLEEGVKSSMKQYEKDAKVAYGLQVIQAWFQCCGLDGYQDYDIAGGMLPASCCDQMSKVTINNPRETCPRSELVFENGCKHSPFLTKTLGSVTYTAYALVLLQIIVILAACCLSRDLRAMR